MKRDSISTWNYNPFITFAHSSTVRGTVGGLIDDEIPIICGGCAGLTCTTACYKYVSPQWTLTFSMNHERRHYSGMSSSPYQYPSHKFYIGKCKIVFGANSLNFKCLRIIFQITLTTHYLTAFWHWFGRIRLE